MSHVLYNNVNQNDDAYVHSSYAFTIIGGNYYMMLIKVIVLMIPHFSLFPLITIHSW